MKIVFFIFFSACIAISSANFYQSFEKFEKNTIQKYYVDCSERKALTLTRYEDLKKEGDLRIKAVVLTHYVNGQEVKYYLDSVVEGIKASKVYDKSKPMVIISHGFFGNIFFLSPIHEKIIEQFKIRNNTNLFAMNSNAVTIDSYLAASTYTQILGERLGEILADLYRSGFSNFHLIGHSLGSHLSGFAGKNFYAQTGTKLERITGLDTSGPCFMSEPPERRLIKSDAQFVDIIYSNMNVYGTTIVPIGHVNFFPNGGDLNPGCQYSSCNHNMASEFFAESINNNNFLALECADWNTFKSGGCSGNDQMVLGYWTPTSARGNYFLKTNAASNFAMGANGIIP